MPDTVKDFKADILSLLVTIKPEDQIITSLSLENTKQSETWGWSHADSTPVSLG
jgi:hypothetical protein